MELKPGEKWECLSCLKTFKSDTDLTAHMVTHDPDVKVKCEICGIISKNRRALAFHMSRLHPNRERPSCDTCHRVFSTRVTLRRHIADLHSTKERPRLSCGILGCDKTYQHKRHLSRHMKAEHSENPVRYSCTRCGKEFKTRTHLERHNVTHAMATSLFNCATCGRSFAYKSDMECHEKTHLDKATRDVLHCHACPQTFFTATGLQRHVGVVHENERNYPCPFCDKRFAQPSNLKFHVEARHATNKELTYSCDKCEYKSHSKDYFAKHAKRHKAGSHECYFCRKKFVTFHELVIHCRVHTLEKLK